MTTIPEQAGPPAVEQVPQVVGTGRLEQLHVAYEVAKAAADEAAQNLKDLTDAIKSELGQALPEGTTKVDLVGPPDSGRVPLRMSWVESWRIDSRKLKAEDPETYVRYAKKSGTWTLKARS